MGHMIYFIFEPPSAQPRDPADSKFFWAKNTQNQITKYSAFLDFSNEVHVATRVLVMHITYGVYEVFVVCLDKIVEFCLENKTQYLHTIELFDF
jgi:predicted AlkP superfamily pyrophosphatase or phosphodiesterase